MKWWDFCCETHLRYTTSYHISKLGVELAILLFGLLCSPLVPSYELPMPINEYVRIWTQTINDSWYLSGKLNSQLGDYSFLYKAFIASLIWFFRFIVVLFSFFEVFKKLFSLNLVEGKKMNIILPSKKTLEFCDF